MSKTVAIIGANGFVGSMLSRSAQRAGLSVLNVSRENYQDTKNNSHNIDVVINTAMPSGRFAAKNNPVKDFSETVEKTFNIKNDFNLSKVVQISSISARVQLDTIYGRHKLSAEGLLNPETDLIIRLGPLYDESLTKGALIDIINDQKVFVDAKTKYAFTPLEWACQLIISNLDHTGVEEVGAKGYVCLEELATTIESTSKFTGQNDDQIFPTADGTAPDASEVIQFAQARKQSIQDLMK